MLLSPGKNPWNILSPSQRGSLNIYRQFSGCRPRLGPRKAKGLAISERSCKPVMQLKSVHPAKMLRRVNERAGISSDRSRALASVTPTARDYPRCLSRGARARGGRPSLWETREKNFPRRVEPSSSSANGNDYRCAPEAHRYACVLLLCCKRESPRGGPARVERWPAAREKDEEEREEQIGREEKGGRAGGRVRKIAARAPVELKGGRREGWPRATEGGR